MKRIIFTLSITALTATSSFCTELTYKDVFNKYKTKDCRIKSCLILIADNDTICWNHSEKAEINRLKQLREKGSFNHYQYDRPVGSPYTK